MAVSISIHDVMPETLGAVAELLALAEAAGAGQLTLLVVPGRPWTPAELQHLRAWQARGHRLAGHGWQHRAPRWGGLRHRLHGLLLSRNVAEHLCEDAEGILRLMRRCHAWFLRRNLGAPELYVPPAWALGALPKSRLAEQPFARVETLAGMRDAASGRLQRQGLLGYEADGRLRALALRTSNAASRCLARRRLRIALHPQDLRLRLAEDLRRDLSRFARADVVGAAGAPLRSRNGTTAFRHHDRPGLP